MGYSALARKWHMPFIMQIVNSRVVRRSNFFNHYGARSGPRPASLRRPAHRARPARAPRRGARAEGAEGRWVRAASAHACGAGDNFSYHEVQEAGGPVVAALGTAALAIGFAALRFARPIVLRFLPKPGEGPSVEMQVRAPGRVRARAAAPAGDMPCPQ